jgi:hypothetical protein
MGNHYKNFQVYISGLKNWIIFFEKNKELTQDWDMLVFIDNNIYQDKHIMDIMYSCSKIKPVLFTCSEYMVNQYHMDLFGTMTRFFPLFDFPNNYTKQVFCVDIDLHDEKDKDHINIKNILKLNQTTTRTTISYGVLSDYFVRNITPYILATSLFSGKKYEHSLLVNFIKNAHKIQDLGQYGKRKTPFGFGTDELFLNKYLLVQSPTVWMFMQYSINWFIFHFKRQLLRENMKQLTFEVLTKIVGKYSKGQSIDKMFDFIDKHTYEVTKKTPENVYLSQNYYNVLHYLLENKIEWMPIHIMKIIVKYFDNIVFCSAFIKINTETKKVIDIHINK